MGINQELLEILACPKCKGDIYLNDAEDGLICENCKLLYEIRDDIPIMLIDEDKTDRLKIGDSTEKRPQSPTIKEPLPVTSGHFNMYHE